MTFTVFTYRGQVYDVVMDLYEAIAIARRIGGYVIDDEGNRA